LYSFILRIKLYDLKTEVNQNKVKLKVNLLLNKCLTANQKITTIRCVLIINKQLVELLFIKDEQFRESDITNYNSKYQS
jgi:hypothetical protein